MVYSVFNFINNNESKLFPSGALIKLLPFPDNLEEIRQESHQNFINLMKKIKDHPTDLFNEITFIKDL
jgi:hypothetical protein